MQELRCPHCGEVFQVDETGYAQLARQVREITPLVHERGLYLSDGQITDALPQGQQDFVDRFLWAEYWRENNGR